MACPVHHLSKQTTVRVDPRKQSLTVSLTEVGKRVLELIHELYEVGIHDLPLLLERYRVDVEGGRGKVVVSVTAWVAVNVLLGSWRRVDPAHAGQQRITEKDYDGDSQRCLRNIYYDSSKPQPTNVFLL